MKGVKTEVKTDWKNLAHGNTRHYDFRSGGNTPYIQGFKKGDKLCLSCTIRWRFAEENSVGTHIQSTDYKGSYPFGDLLQGKSNEDNIGYVTSTAIATSENALIIYSPKWKGEYGAVKDKDSYLILENLMVSKDDFLPYVDSNELKAEEGAINKARIVALVLSEERRAA
jgi:hypothetical protein